MNEWKFKYWGAPGNIQQMFEDWSPLKGDNEIHYKKELYKYFRKKFRKANIQKEFEQGKIRADFIIDNEIVVKVLYNLQKTSDYQKAMSKILDYRGWLGKVVIVLLGKTEPKLSMNLKKDVDSLNIKLFKGKTEGKFIAIEKAL